MKNRMRNQFDTLHEEERASAVRSFWGGRKTPEGCDHLGFESYLRPEPRESGDWLSSLSEAVVKLLEKVEERRRNHLRLVALTDRVRNLESKLAGIVTCEAFIVPISTFEPEPFDLLREIKAVVQKVDEDEYTATFFDANLGTAGCSPTDAIQNLKDLLLSRFEYLNGLPPEKLGPAPAKQAAVLRSFIRKRQ